MNKVKKILAVILIVALACAPVTGCSNSSRKKTDWLYSCVPDNMLGLRGYYYEDGTMFIIFDNDEIREHEYPSSGLKDVLENKEWDPYRPLYIFSADYTPGIYVEDVDLNITGKELILSFEMDAKDVENMTGFTIQVGPYFSFDSGTNIITAELWGGECLERYTQRYDPAQRLWDDMEYELNIYEMTDWEG